MQERNGTHFMHVSNAADGAWLLIFTRYHTWDIWKVCAVMGITL
jgi:hypothetical protein